MTLNGCLICSTRGTGTWAHLFGTSCRRIATSLRALLECGCGCFDVATSDEPPSSRLVHRNRQIGRRALDTRSEERGAFVSGYANAPMSRPLSRRYRRIGVEVVQSMLLILCISGGRSTLFQPSRAEA